MHDAEWGSIAGYAPSSELGRETNIVTSVPPQPCADSPHPPTPTPPHPHTQPSNPCSFPPLVCRSLDDLPLDHLFSDDPQPNFPTSGLVFAGLMSLMDPPREGVKEAVADCHAASIKVFMVTGEGPATCFAMLAAAHAAQGRGEGEGGGRAGRIGITALLGCTCWGSLGAAEASS